MLNKVQFVPSGKSRLAGRITILLLAAILSFTGSLNSQTKAQVFIKLNYNYFGMGDLKNLQGELLSDLTSQGIGAKITESYPATFGFRFGLLIPLPSLGGDKIFLGGFFDYATTGGRVYYSDYSGEIKADQVANAYSVGGILSLRAGGNDNFKLFFNINACLIFSGLDNEFLIRVGEEEQKEEYSFRSLSIGVEPAIVPTITLNRFDLGLSASYLVSLPTGLEYNRRSGTYLVNNNGDKVSIDWSGLKLGLIVKYSF